MKRSESTPSDGWPKLVENYPWFSAAGRFPLPAYSEFLPSPRLGRKPYGKLDEFLFQKDDPFGWTITEWEELYELKPGLTYLANLIVNTLCRLGRGEPSPSIGGPRGRNLTDNPYWPQELAAQAGQLVHERYVTLLPLALSKTQDDKGRVRWTLFGGSEQGPEQAFWQSFYTAPDREIPEQESLAFMASLLASVYGESADKPEALLKARFRVLPSEPHPRFPYWTPASLPKWCRPFLWNGNLLPDETRYLLTFRPFSALPEEVRRRYLGGQLHLLPFPGSLVFWGMPGYIRIQEKLPLVMQTPLLRIITRRRAPEGLQIPQSGWLNEPNRERKTAELQAALLVNTYRRTHRFNHVNRYDDEMALLGGEDRVTQVLFSTAPEVIGLYNKPMARNCRLLTENLELLLDGPRATRQELIKAAAAVFDGGLFEYHFHFPPMRVGLYDVFWHRPLIAYLDSKAGQPVLMSDALSGYLTAYLSDQPDPAQPVLMWPRPLRRPLHLSTLTEFSRAPDYYSHQTPLNLVKLLDTWRIMDQQPLPRRFARRLLSLSKQESLDEWLKALPGRADTPKAGNNMKTELEQRIEPVKAVSPKTAPNPPELLTFGDTATRPFEEGFWKDIVKLAHNGFINKNNADCMLDDTTQRLRKHVVRDLGALGRYLLERHQAAIQQAGMQDRAVCGEQPFRWQTDFDYSYFDGWQHNQDGSPHERNLLVVIPGSDRNEAVIMADHYDTAFMEDVYDKARGGAGARLAAAGADDNHSSTAALLQAAPVFLKLAREGKLARDIWILHLTGEEFPADCLGARQFCRALVENTLQLQRPDGSQLDLSKTRVVGAYVLDMIAHNNDRDLNVFQISPGRSRASMRLALEAHIANELWNAQAPDWNRREERRGKGRATRSADPAIIPDIALYPHLHGEVRPQYDPLSSLFNTDGQIFSDVGVPVTLFMEDYDIHRAGYHDSQDTLANIDLDYGAGVAAIAIEAVARTATAKSFP